MIAFPDMLITPAEKAGMRIPNDADKFDANEYPHFAVFCNAQLGQPMPYMGCHWENAHVIAKIPDEKIKSITFGEIIDLGFQVGYSIP